MYLNQNTGVCACGKVHASDLEKLILGKGALASLPEEIVRMGCKKVFVLADVHTYAAAGERVIALLEHAGIVHATYVYQAYNN